MQTILLQSDKPSTSWFILEMAKRIKVKAKILSEDDLEDIRLNKLLIEDEKNLEEVDEKKVYRILRKHGAKI